MLKSGQIALFLQLLLIFVVLWVLWAALGPSGHLWPPPADDIRDPQNTTFHDPPLY